MLLILQRQLIIKGRDNFKLNQSDMPGCRRDGAKDLRLSQLVRRGADKIKLTVLALVRALQVHVSPHRRQLKNDTQGIVTPPRLAAGSLDGASRTAYVW